MIDRELESKLHDLVSSLGYQIYDLELVRQDGELIFRIYLSNFRSSGDKAPIRLDDCSGVSEVISPFLDVEFEIKDGYNLEVSSCGLERVLKKERHFLHSIGDEVQVTLKDEEKKIKLIDKLVSFDVQTLGLEGAGSLQMDRVKKVKTILKWTHEKSS